MFVHCVVMFLALTAAVPRAQEDTTSPVLKDFIERVGEYWDLHKKMDGEAPKIDKKKESPEAIVEHEKKLRADIVAARTNAAEGDLFTPSVQKSIVATIRQELSSSQKGKTAREMILGEGNPKNPESKAPVVVAVNATYPHSASLSTVPPSVLLKLPKLPEGLEYRFVGRHLILFDSKANLIVDILRNAVR